MNNNTEPTEPTIDEIISAGNIGTPSITNTNFSQQSAIEEQVSIDNQQLENKAKANEHQRSETWKSHFAWAFIGAFWFFWSCFIIMSGILIYHWITPIKLHWLTDIQLDHLKTIIIAVFASSAISNQQGKLK